MTAHDDLDQQLSAFLRDGPNELPYESFDAIRDRTEVTRQRVVIGPWRVPEVNRFIAIGAGAAAVVVVLLIGAQLLGWPSDGLAADPTSTATSEPTLAPTPAPTVLQSDRPLSSSRPSPTPEPSPTSAASDEPPSGFADETFMIVGSPDPVTVRIRRPVAWKVTDDGDSLAQMERRPGGGTPPTLFVTHVSRVNLNPCGSGAGGTRVGTSAEDLANALASLPGLTAVGPTAQVVGGHPAWAVTLVAPEASADCSRWTLWSGSDEHWLVPGERNRLWIVDVDGTRLVISAETFESSSPEAFAEQTEMVESIELSRVR